jgi:hypothetical protein
MSLALVNRKKLMHSGAHLGTYTMNTIISAEIGVLVATFTKVSAYQAIGSFRLTLKLVW